MNIHFPGRTVELEGFTCTVYPLGVKHLRKFQRQIGRIVSSVSAMKVPAGTDKDVLEKWVIAEVVPLIVADAFELLIDCIIIKKGDDTIPLEEAPHHWLPILGTHWVQDSFGSEEKIRPWKEALAKVSKALPTPPKTN